MAIGQPQFEKAPVPGEASGVESRDKDFAAGAEVSVLRSSGEIDAGWRLTAIQQGDALVVKGAGEEMATKNIPMVELVALNAPESTRFGFGVEKWAKAWQDCGGSLPPDWEKPLAGRQSLSVQEARALFGQLPLAVASQWQEFMAPQRGKAIVAEKWRTEFATQSGVDLQAAQIQAGKAQALFGAKPPYDLFPDLFSEN